MNIKMTLFNLVLARMTSEDKENSAWHAIWPHREMPVEEHYDLYNIDAAQRRHRGYRPSFRVRGTDYPRRNLSRVPTVCFKVASRCRMGKASYIRNDTDDIGAICLAYFSVYLSNDFFSFKYVLYALCITFLTMEIKG
jgi:hypothetical protein